MEIIQLVVTLLLVIFVGAVTWFSRNARTRAVGAVFLAAVGVSLLVAVSSSTPYPWSNVLVLTVALSTGILFGRLPRIWFALLLMLLAGFDLASFVSGIQTTHQPSSMQGAATLTNITVQWYSGHFREGVLDVAVLTGLVLGWTREWNLVIAICLGVVASMLPWVVVAFGWHGGLPLLPFMALVWLGSIKAARLDAV